jgi:hypothetical protein
MQCRTFLESKCPYDGELAHNIAGRYSQKKKDRKKENQNFPLCE